MERDSIRMKGIFINSTRRNSRCFHKPPSFSPVELPSLIIKDKRKDHQDRQVGKEGVIFHRNLVLAIDTPQTTYPIPIQATVVPKRPDHLGGQKLLHKQINPIMKGENNPNDRITSGGISQNDFSSFSHSFLLE